MKTPYTKIMNDTQDNRLIKWLFIFLDFVILWIIIHIANSFYPEFTMWDDNKERIFLLVCTFAMILAESRYSTVAHRRLVGANEILSRCTQLVLTQTMLSYLFLRVINFSSRIGWQLLFMGISLLVLIVLARLVERLLLKLLRRSGHNIRTITLIGSDIEIHRLSYKLFQNPSYGYQTCGNYGNLNDFAALLDTPDELRLGNEVYLCVSCKEHDLIERTARLCDYRMAKFYYVPIAEERLTQFNLRPLLIDDIEVMSAYTSPLDDPLNRLLKRLADIVLSILFLLPTALLLPFIVIAIKWQSPGPIFFRQQRTGLNGHTFYCYKFRSMHVNADADKLQATQDDPRKFPFGNLMRKTNIDELPQFWNVLIGDMSIVGPRPHMLAHTDLYKKQIDKYMVRHFVKPGVTGWAQVTGYRGETRELWQMEGRVKRDIWYMQHWSFWLDMRIIWMTVRNVVKKDEKAY